MLLKMLNLLISSSCGSAPVPNVRYPILQIISNEEKITTQRDKMRWTIILWYLSEDLCFLRQTKPEMEMWNDLKIGFRLEEDTIKVNKEVATTPPPIQWPPSAFVGQRQWSCRGQRQGIGGTGTPRNHPWRLPSRPVGSRFSHVWDKDFNHEHQLTWQ